MLACSGLARSAPITVESIDITGKNLRGEPVQAAQVTMPFIRSSKPAVAAQINDALFISQLGMLAPKKPADSLAAAGVVDPVSQTFTVTGEEGRILSVNFEIEGCGAYCETYHAVHSFDTATGRRIDDAILTDAGKRELARLMAKERLSRFQAQVAIFRNQLQAAKKKKAVSKDELDDIDERIDLNRECADTEAARLKDELGLARAYAYYTQQHANGALVLTSERCSNHARRALDDVGEVAMTFAYAALGPYLTGYGKALLLGEGSARDTGFDRQVLHGHINGNIAITMQLARDPGTDKISGVYFYDKFGKPIELEGTRQGDTLTLTERFAEEVGDGVTGATITLVVAGTQLHGQWIGKQRFPVQLTVP